MGTPTFLDKYDKNKARLIELFSSNREDKNWIEELFINYEERSAFYFLPESFMLRMKTIEKNYE